MVILKNKLINVGNINETWKRFKLFVSCETNIERFPKYHNERNKLKKKFQTYFVKFVIYCQQKYQAGFDSLRKPHPPNFKNLQNSCTMCD